MSSTVNESEHELIEACVRGDERSRTEFVKRYGRLIAKVVLSTRERLNAYGTEVDDLIGHVYERLLEEECKRLRAWRGMSKFSTYLVMVTRNLVVDHLKKTSRQVAPSAEKDVAVEPQWLDPDDEREEAAQREARLAALKVALKTLPCQQSAIMLLRLEGNSLRDIAAMMRIPQGTVFVLNSRALQKLRKTITAMTGS